MLSNCFLMFSISLVFNWTVHSSNTEDGSGNGEHGPKSMHGINQATSHLSTTTNLFPTSSNTLYQTFTTGSSMVGHTTSHILPVATSATIEDGKTTPQSLRLATNPVTTTPADIEDSKTTSRSIRVTANQDITTAAEIEDSKTTSRSVRVTANQDTTTPADIDDSKTTFQTLRLASNQDTTTTADIEDIKTTSQSLRLASNQDTTTTADIEDIKTSSQSLRLASNQDTCTTTTADIEDIKTTISTPKHLPPTSTLTTHITSSEGPSTTSKCLDERGWNLLGTDWGCCGNYEGCCTYASFICYIHDALCRCCDVGKSFCGPRCKPDRSCTHYADVVTQGDEIVQTVSNSDEDMDKSDHGELSEHFNPKSEPPNSDTVNETAINANNSYTSNAVKSTKHDDSEDFKIDQVEQALDDKKYKNQIPGNETFIETAITASNSYTSIANNLTDHDSEHLNIEQLEQALDDINYKNQIPYDETYMDIEMFEEATNVLFNHNKTDTSSTWSKDNHLRNNLTTSDNVETDGSGESADEILGP
ncbi:uncharacterized protein LOC128206889 [Mya arenaria]|uniref:uncharacterized protein LOC128206889 n=1 Tax=Mya arenaria TaxID=6604 RepID=UPI0022E26BCA|nr:uncharacterized protein LOC128206889 [Mya arenaria]